MTKSLLKMILTRIESGSKDYVFSILAKTIGKSINTSIARLMPKMNQYVQRAEYLDRT
jgi:hypothetical protein